MKVTFDVLDSTAVIQQYRHCWPVYVDIMLVPACACLWLAYQPQVLAASWLTLAFHICTLEFLLAVAVQTSLHTRPTKCICSIH
jgi:hypothetical protein